MICLVPHRFWKFRYSRPMLYDGDTFKHDTRTFTVRVDYDTSMGRPWEEHDGHGPVRELRRHSAHREIKHAGERVLHRDGADVWLYDWQEATKIAKRDGWGISWDERRAFALKHWRQPTRKEVVRMAVQSDFDYLRRWLNDQWHWVYVRVECDDPLHGEYDRSLGGMQSDDYEGITQVAYELADEINDELNLLDASYYEDQARIEEYKRPDMYEEGNW